MENGKTQKLLNLIMKTKTENPNISPELDRSIAFAIRDSLFEVVKSKLGAYNSPLDKILAEAIENRKSDLIKLFNESFEITLNNEEFRKNLKEAFNHKLARVLLNKFEGEVEKRANDLRATPENRARIVLAIESVLKENLT